MFSIMISSWTLFFGLALIMIGNGVQLVLLGVRASDAGFTNFTSGIVMGGYFLGLFLGSLIVPRFLARGSYSRFWRTCLNCISCGVITYHHD